MHLILSNLVFYKQQALIVMLRTVCFFCARTNFNYEKHTVKFQDFVKIFWLNYRDLLFFYVAIAILPQVQITKSCVESRMPFCF